MKMTKQQFLEHCFNTYSTSPDYPFDDLFETAVLRHSANRKWYAIVMRVSRRKFGFDSDDVIDVVNLKLPTEMFGSFGATDGVFLFYLAYEFVPAWAVLLGSCIEFFNDNCIRVDSGDIGDLSGDFLMLGANAAISINHNI